MVFFWLGWQHWSGHSTYSTRTQLSIVIWCITSGYKTLEHFVGANGLDVDACVLGSSNDKCTQMGPGSKWKPEAAQSNTPKDRNNHRDHHLAGEQVGFANTTRNPRQSANDTEENVANSLAIKYN